MNPDFVIKEDTRKVEGGVERLTRILYKGVGIANIVHDFTPSEKGIKKGKKAAVYNNGTVEDYLKTHGHLAEWRMRWNFKAFDPGYNWVNWDDSMKVDVDSPRGSRHTGSPDFDELLGQFGFVGL